MSRSFARLPLVCCWVFLAGACGETSFTFLNGATDGPPLSVSYLVEGGGLDDLQSLEVTVSKIQLLRPEDLSEPAGAPNALSGPVSVELLGLERRARLLTTRYYGDGIYSHVRVAFSAAAPRAQGHGGELLQWEDPVARAAILALDAPFVADRGQALAATVVLRVDPAESLVAPGSDAPPGSPWTFRPAVRARVLGDGELVRSDDFWGGLLSVADDRRTIQVASDFERTSAERAVIATVGIGGGTLLLQPDGVPAAGLGGLAPDPALVNARFWVRGAYAGGSAGWLPELEATSVLLDSLQPDQQSDAAVTLEARVVGSQGGGLFTVRPIEFERGDSDAELVLDALGRPSLVQVRLDPSSLVLGATGQFASSQDLSAGARVKLHFAAFDMEPFQVTRAAIQGRPAHAGTLLAPQVGSNQILVHLIPGAAAIEAGWVRDELTPVALTLSQIFATLDVEGSPEVYAFNLPEGLRVSARGEITGSPSAPRIDGARLTVRPGRFHGTVTAAFEVDSVFVAGVESIEAPFGGESDGPPFAVLLAPECVFEGDAESATEFFAAFSGLSPGASLDVDVSGIASSVPNTLVAYQVRAHAR